MSAGRDLLRGLRASAGVTLYGAPARNDHPVPASASIVPPTLGTGIPAAAGPSVLGPAADISRDLSRPFSPRVARRDLLALVKTVAAHDRGEVSPLMLLEHLRARLEASAAAARGARELLAPDAWTLAIQALIAGEIRELFAREVERAAFAAVAVALLPLIERDLRRLEARIAHG